MSIAIAIPIDVYTRPVLWPVLPCIVVNPRRACAGGLRYLSCVSVCRSVGLSVTTLAATSFVLTLKVRYVGVYYNFSWILIRGFSIKPSVQKSWCGKANMLMSIYLLRPPMALMQRHFTRQGLLWFFQV